MKRKKSYFHSAESETCSFSRRLSLRALPRLGWAPNSPSWTISAKYYDSHGSFWKESSNHGALNSAACTTSCEQRLTTTLCRNLIKHSAVKLSSLSNSGSLLDEFSNCGMVFYRKHSAEDVRVQCLWNLWTWQCGEPFEEQTLHPQQCPSINNVTLVL